MNLSSDHILTDLEIEEILQRSERRAERVREILREQEQWEAERVVRLHRRAETNRRAAAAICELRRLLNLN